MLKEKLGSKKNFLIFNLCRVLVVGHNPGLEELVEMLAGEMHLMPTTFSLSVQRNFILTINKQY